MRNAYAMSSYGEAKAALEKIFRQLERINPSAARTVELMKPANHLEEAEIPNDLEINLLRFSRRGRKNLEAQERSHKALEFPTIPIQLKHSSALRLRQALLVEKHFVMMFRIV
jgi:hypothetical protein